MSGDIQTYISAFTGLASAAIGYGVLRATVNRLQIDVDRVVSEFDKYVTVRHFEGVIQAIQSDQAEMKRDIKEILSVLSKRH